MQAAPVHGRTFGQEQQEDERAEQEYSAPRRSAAGLPHTGAAGTCRGGAIGAPAAQQALHGRADRDQAQHRDHTGRGGYADTKGEPSGADQRSDDVTYGEHGVERTHDRPSVAALDVDGRGVHRDL